MSRLEKLLEAAERDVQGGYHSLTLMSLIEPVKKRTLWEVTTDHMYCGTIVECVTSL